MDRLKTKFDQGTTVRGEGKGRRRVHGYIETGGMISAIHAVHLTLLRVYLRWEMVRIIQITAC